MMMVSLLKLKVHRDSRIRPPERVQLQLLQESRFGDKTADWAEDLDIRHDNNVRLLQVVCREI